MKREIQITTAEKKIMFREIQNTELQQEIYTEGNKIEITSFSFRDITNQISKVGNSYLENLNYEQYSRKFIPRETQVTNITGGNSCSGKYKQKATEN